MSTTKIKVLFFAEGATLSHVARPFVLAQNLDPKRFEVMLARPTSYAWLTKDAGFEVIDLECQDHTVFSNRLSRGLTPYDFGTLQRYVDTDLELMAAKQPDIVVGDFRLSLSVSARLCKVPYFTICDAYWNPERTWSAPLPAFGFTHYVPIPIMEILFKAISPLILRIHAKPLETLRKSFGLPSLGYDLRRCFTDADFQLYPNFPALFPDIKTSSRADFIGPVIWSPHNRNDVDFLNDRKLLVYVTMGSSGDTSILRFLLPVLKKLDVNVLIASAGKELPIDASSNNIRCFDFLPGDQICQHAALVICNGGSPTTNQALMHGVPVLGIAQNFDQLLNMQDITRFGAGLMLRADRPVISILRDSVEALLHDNRYAERAHALARSIENFRPETNFEHHVRHFLRSTEEV